MSKNPPAYPDMGFTPASTYQPPNQGIVPPTVIINTVPQVTVGPNQAHVLCPSCRADIMTEVRHEADTRTHLWAACLCLFGCWPCVCLPYCMDTCRATNHYCPNCHAYIGKYDS